MVKSVRHFCLQNERDILLRFQNRTAHIRKLLDEAEDPVTPPSIVLRYMDDDLLHASDNQRLNRREVKYVAKGVLKALAVLHEDGFVHAGM